MINRLRHWMNLQRARSVRDLPEELRTYVKLHEQSNSLKQNILAARYVVFDTETTGLDTHKDTVLTIGAIALSNGKIEVADSLEIAIQSEHVGGKKSVPVHQILRADLTEGFEQEEALIRFLDFVKDDVLVAHFAWFDVKMISKMMRQVFGFPLLNRQIDTIELAKRLDSSAYRRDELQGGKYTLDVLCERYGIQIHNRHNAAGDALATAQLLQILLRKAHKRGIHTLKEIVQ